MKCYLDKPSYLCGESVLINVILDNTKCGLDVNKVTAVLKKIVVLQSS